MYPRAILALVLAVLLGSQVSADGNNSKVGDLVILEMQGELAREFARRQGDDVAGVTDLRISTIAMITGEPAADKLTLELKSVVKRKGQKDRLITMTTTIDAAKVSERVTPKGAAIYASPAEHKAGAKPTITESEVKSYEVKLSDLGAVKLQTWDLAE